MDEQGFNDVSFKAKQAGYLFFPYHAFIDYQGVIHEGREKNAVGNAEIDTTEEAFTILVDAPSSTRVTVAQREAVVKVCEEYPQAEFIEYEGYINEDQIL